MSVTAWAVKSKFLIIVFLDVNLDFSIAFRAYQQPAFSICTDSVHC
jgi:hypothetical protein